MPECSGQLGLFGKRDFPGPSPSQVARLEKLVLSIARSTGLKVSSIKWKDNRRVMASVGKGGVLHLNKIYLRARESDLIALARVMSGKARQDDHTKFREFIENHLPREVYSSNGNGNGRLVILPPKGLFHDLLKALDRIASLLEKPLEPEPILGWTAARVGRSGITWGTHRPTNDGPLILVNAVLDAHDVPNFVLEHIIWHELCHQIAPPRTNRNGRRVVHSKRFKELEARYPRLAEAEKWERDHVIRFIKRHM